MERDPLQSKRARVVDDPLPTSLEKTRAPSVVEVAACRGNGRIRIERRERPKPGRGELLLRMEACGFCGTDLFKLENDTVSAGDVLGHELVGRVEELGDEVTEISLGERVVVPHHVACGRCPLCVRGSETLCQTFRENLMDPGGFSELVRIRRRAVARALRKLPEHLRTEAAVFLEPAACVLRGVERAGLAENLGERSGGCVVVLGSGSMGLLHVHVIRALFDQVRIVACDGLEERRASARACGAIPVEPGAPLRRAVEEASSGLGADAIFDTVGGAALLEAGLDVSREGGTVVLFAHARHGERADFDLNRLFKAEKRVVGTYSGGLAEQDVIWQLLVSGRLDPSPLVTHRLPLSQLEDAARLARRHEALKILIVPGEVAS